MGQWALDMVLYFSLYFFPFLPLFISLPPARLELQYYRDIGASFLYSFLSYLLTVLLSTFTTFGKGACSFVQLLVKLFFLTAEFFSKVMSTPFILYTIGYPQSTNQYICHRHRPYNLHCRHQSSIERLIIS